MFPIERPQMLNTARGAMGQSISSGSISMMNLLDEKSLEKIAESAGARIWQGFMTFGSASAGVLAIFFLIRLIKLIVDTIIHGYALHSVYGWSLHLIGAIWSSVTHLLLHLAGTATRKLPLGHQDTEALIPAAGTSSETRSTPEEQPSPPSALSRNASETQNPVYYKELRDLLNSKE